MVDLSICFPGIRPHLWERLFHTALAACNRHSFEMVAVGPYDPPATLSVLPNFKFIRDWGCPSRCAQLGTTVCEGKLMTWASDDGVFVPGSLDAAIDLWHQNNEKTEVVMRYTEGHGGHGTSMPDWYWIATRHADLSLPGVKEGWLTAGVGLLSLEYFRYLGGWDCSYEHLNMCCHDLSFRLQKDGGNLVLSPTDVLLCDYMPGHEGDHGPVHESGAHDFPHFKNMYAHYTDRIRIPYDNWKQSPEKWIRRFPN